MRRRQRESSTSPRAAEVADVKGVGPNLLQAYLAPDTNDEAEREDGVDGDAEEVLVNAAGFPLPLFSFLRSVGASCSFLPWPPNFLCPVTLSPWFLRPLFSTAQLSSWRKSLSRIWWERISTPFYCKLFIPLSYKNFLEGSEGEYRAKGMP